MVIESSIAFPNRSPPPPLLPPQAFDRASLMDPLDSPLLAARSRYDPHPPPPHHLVEPNCYPHQSHHHHHHHASFPSPTPPPPPYCSHNARYLRHERESRLPVDDGGRLRVPYQIDPFPQPPLSFPDRSPLPEDLYPTLRPHLIGHGEHFVRDSPESRVFDDDRFRVVDESQDFLRFRWEDEEERRHLVPCSRANLYREDLAVGLERRKRPRWLKDTDLEEHLGGPSKRHLRVWDKEIDHPHRILLPSPSTIPACDSPLRTPRDFVAIDGKREADFVAEWRYLLPPMKSYSDKEREDNRGERPLHMPFYSDRNRDIVRDREDMRELGPILERHLRSPFPTMRSTGNSYSHINRQFETTSDVYDLPTTSTVYSREENNFGDNRGKRKLNRENDQIIIWSSGKQTAKRPSAKFFNRGKEQIVISTSSKQSAKRPSALSRLQSGISVWSRLQEKPLFHTSPSELVSQPTTSVKHQLEVSTPNFSLKSSNLVGEVSSPRSALLTSDGKGQEWWTPKRLVKKKLARKGEEFAIPVVSGSLVLEAKDGISKMLTLNTSQKKLDDPEASDNQRSSSIKDVNNANLGSSSRRAISTVTMDEDIGQELMDDNVREEEGALHSVIGGKIKETNCIIEKQEIELDTCANLELCQSEFIDTENAEKSVLTDPSRCDEEEKGKQFVELGQTLNQNCANALLDSGDLNIGSSSPINHVSIEGKLDDETEQLSSALQAQNTIDENHDSQNFEGSDDNKKAGDLDKDFVTFSSEYSSSPLRKSEQLVMPVGHMTSPLTSYSIFADNLKMKQHTVGNQHIEVDVDAKEHKEISGGDSAKSDAYLCMEMQNLLVNLPPQLMDTDSDGHLPDITTDEKDACLASQANVESPQFDNLKPREEDLVASSIFMSEFQDASPCVAPEQPHSGLPDRYGCNKDGLIKDICDQDQKVVTEDKYLLAFREPLAPEVEGVTSAQNISCKPMFEKENNLLSDDTMKQKTMESKDMNGQEHLNQKTMSTVGFPKDTPIRANSVKCSKESTHSHLSLRHKTWHRKNAPSSISQVILQSQKGGSLSKLSPRKLGKIHNSYVRKGNSLFRKSASQPSESLGSMRKLNKGITDKNIVFGSNGFANNILACSNPSFESKLSSEPTQPSQSLGSTSQLNKDIKEKSINSGNNILNCPNNAFERPKTPPLPLATKLSDSTFVYSSEAPHVLSENSVAETRTDFQDTPLILPSGGINDQNDTSDKICEPLGKSVIYVKRRSNQLVAASGQKVTDSVNSSLDKSPALISLASSDYYYRKNKNQLIRNVYSSEGQSNVVLHPGNGNMSRQKVSGSTVNGVTSTLPKKKLNKAQDKRHKYSSFSHVWTLSGKRPSKKGISSLRRIKVLPYLFPWKRATLLQSLKSQLVRKKDTLYTLQTDGFFLKKSGLSRLGRSSLKWSRSMQRRSKEAELAVAEVERKNREQDNLLSVSGLKHSINSVLNEQSCDKDQGTGNNSISLVPRKSLGGNNDRYVRIGNGNQLVRDPKKLTRILASEKVRWSLHTARLRLAKKNQYCQFFTRFGKCNKKGGKCPYIHDPSKVAICTKFLNGSCSNMDCKLAHKIIPERMPDCSYFLRGLCTNTSCSYRHVNVNPNASVCEGFLKGYCVDGDECCKKHSYVCPIYQATGKCLQGSKCKLHHPKTKNKPKKRKDALVQGNTWGRYFGSGISLVGEPLAVSLDTKVEKKANDLFCNGQFAEFIALAPDENDDEASFMVSETDAHPTHFESGNDALQNNDLDALTKPIRIMRKDYPPLPASTNGS